MRVCGWLKDGEVSGCLCPFRHSFFLCNKAFTFSAFATALPFFFFDGTVAQVKKGENKKRRGALDEEGGKAGHGAAGVS